MANRNILIQKKQIKKAISKFNARYKIVCISPEKSIFRVTFEHGYIHSFSEMVKRNAEYYVEYFKYVLCKILHFKKKYFLKPFKPFNFKHACMPINEVEFEIALAKKGFEIINEDLGYSYTSYEVAKKISK